MRYYRVLLDSTWFHWEWIGRTWSFRGVTEFLFLPSFFLPLLQDVVVGSPLFTNFDNVEGKYETGRVHVFYQSLRNSFSTSDHIYGNDFSKVPLFVCFP